MTQLDAILDTQGAAQLSLDDLLAVLEAAERDDFPPEPVPSVTAGADPEAVAAIEGAAVATERAEIGPTSHDGTCPHKFHCEMRRRRLPHYRPEVPCHWVTWGDWRRCPIYQNGGNGR